MSGESFREGAEIGAILLAAFMLGSTPTGYLVGRICGIDVRAHGSGNTGATNVSRVLGKKLGALVLIIDLFKGYAAASLALWLPLEWIAPIVRLVPTPEELKGVLGFAALLGHCYSPFLRFKGGKGVATGLGVYLVIAPFQAMMALSVFWLVFRSSRFVSLSSILAALSLPLLMSCDPHPFSKVSLACAWLSAGMIILRHATNVRRLLRGEEPRYRSKEKNEGSTEAQSAVSS